MKKIGVLLLLFMLMSVFMVGPVFAGAAVPENPLEFLENGSGGSEIAEDMNKTTGELGFAATNFLFTLLGVVVVIVILASLVMINLGGRNGRADAMSKIGWALLTIAIGACMGGIILWFFEFGRKLS